MVTGSATAPTMRAALAMARSKGSPSASPKPCASATDQLPVAIAFGQAPLLLMVGGNELPYGVSEYDYAGGIRGEPIEIIPGPVTGLPIPASAEIVVEGFFQDDPMPADTGEGGRYRRMFRFLALDRMQTRLHRWRLNMVTGQCKEERLTDSITEFGVINNRFGGRRHRYAYAATGVEGWFLFNGLVRHDTLTGADLDVWDEEASLVVPHYEKFGERLPKRLWNEHKALLARLKDARSGKQKSAPARPSAHANAASDQPAAS